MMMWCGLLTNDITMRACPTKILRPVQGFTVSNTMHQGVETP